MNLALLQQMPRARRPIEGGTIYFLVLKHDTLFFYRGEEQTVCDELVLLSGCTVNIHPPSLYLDEIYRKEYPLVIERAASPAAGSQEGGPPHRRLFIYAANASEKEDWLVAMRCASRSSPLAGQDRTSSLATWRGGASCSDEGLLGSGNGLGAEGGTDRGSPAPPPSGRLSPRAAKVTAAMEAKMTEMIFMERLGRYVQGPAIERQSQWMNALLGRIFYNVFRSNDIERFIRLKFDRKMLTFPRPFFLGELVLKSVSAGQSLPMLSRGQLHSLGNDGETLVSLDIMYPGGFRLQISTDVRWTIPGLRTVVVPVTMAIHVKRFSGRALLRIKAPPTDRLWVGFYAPPLIEIDVEPIISSKAISWSVIKRAIMRLLHDNVAEFALLPNMDDMTLPPLTIGDAIEGEKPFAHERMPPTIASDLAKGAAEGAVSADQEEGKAPVASRGEGEDGLASLDRVRSHSENDILLHAKEEEVEHRGSARYSPASISTAAPLCNSASMSPSDAFGALTRSTEMLRHGLLSGNHSLADLLDGGVHLSMDPLEEPPSGVGAESHGVTRWHPQGGGGSEGAVGAGHSSRSQRTIIDTSSITVTVPRGDRVTFRNERKVILKQSSSAIYEEARRSDLLALEQSRQRLLESSSSSSAIISEAGSSPYLRTPIQVMRTIKRSVNTLFKGRSPTSSSYGEPEATPPSPAFSLLQDDPAAPLGGAAGDHLEHCHPD